MTINELRELALHAVKGTAPAEFTVENVNSAFADGLKEFAGSYNQFMKNRYDLYDIIIESIDEKLPRDVMASIGAFAEVKTVEQGKKAMFKRKLGRARAKKFLTQVGLSGVYETFRLDSETFELGGHAVGGGATVDFERMLDGEESLAEVVGIVTEGLINAVYVEVERALVAAYDNMPATNRYKGAWSADEMVKLMTVVRAYGNPVIFACPEFIAKMGADAIVPVSTGTGQGVYSPKDIEAIHDTGFIKVFRGASVVEIPQSFVDETNTETYVDPSRAYVFPAGDEKVVKVVLEGKTQIRDHENKDNSMEVYAWKKMGAAILHHNNWCIYWNSGIADTSAKDIYGF
ncbi:MAG: hypothetical protein IIT65_03555 [Lachnospiraceae bacterium]|nr:hypothetical protein [Lachnospiraceae bacterium]